MKKIIAAILAACFAVSLSAIAQDKKGGDMKKDDKKSEAKKDKK